jgi:hypothetical protein
LIEGRTSRLTVREGRAWSHLDRTRGSDGLAVAGCAHFCEPLAGLIHFRVRGQQSGFNMTMVITGGTCELGLNGSDIIANVWSLAVVLRMFPSL